MEKNLKPQEDKALRSCRVPYFHLNNLNLEFSEVVFGSRRVCRVTSGGVAFSISTNVAIVAAGKYKKVKGFFFGFGDGKSKSSMEAKNKAINKCKSKIYFVPIEGYTLSHRLPFKKYGVSLLITPVSKGKGIIAGGCIRQFLQALSLLTDFNLNVKVIKGASSINVIKCFFYALIENVKLRDYYDNLKRR